MVDRLAAFLPGVEHDPVTAVGHTGARGNLVRLLDHLGKQAVARRYQLGQVGVVRTWDHEHMNRSLRINVMKHDSPVCFQNYPGWNLTSRNTAEQAVRHDADLNVCRTVRAPDIYSVTTANPRCTTPLVQRLRQLLDVRRFRVRQAHRSRRSEKTKGRACRGFGEWRSIVRRDWQSAKARDERK
jgi:hypothetical protein